MTRALDHLVIGSPDLDAAGALLARLGFVVGGRNRHPWGTANRIIQFADETFLELITVAEPAAIPPHAPGLFSFGAFVRDALARAPGLSMLALKSADARADCAAFAAAGIGGFAPFDFARKGIGPDGGEAELAFSLAFAADPAMPECGFFTCQQRRPENFWSKAAQAHPNGALGLVRVTLVSENPSDQHIFLAALTGNREMRATSSGIEIAAGAGVIEVTSPEGFAFRYGAAAGPAAPRFAGFEIALAGLEALRAAAGAAGIALLPHRDGLTLPPMHLGTAIRFLAV
ncbi:MAG: VOC family protein [Hyphomicrobiales bacterium]|uniref:VOC family protein n=1 Tax=Rhabdaerophilum calidifontis TaxID=2604328 RepID=UPI001238EF0C|nr:VOC family protein [Rhabdaerophilum calidifontis]MCA1953253.1 VOC family protein [Hyphomicrobiales bacterium]MCA1998558.1 VOC family protein [Hyphomicrobiales bacterium]